MVNQTNTTTDTTTKAALTAPDQTLVKQYYQTMGQLSAIDNPTFFTNDFQSKLASIQRQTLFTQNGVSSLGGIWTSSLNVDSNQSRVVNRTAVLPKDVSKLLTSFFFWWYDPLSNSKDDVFPSKKERIDLLNTWGLELPKGDPLHLTISQNGKTLAKWNTKDLQDFKSSGLVDVQEKVYNAPGWGFSTIFTSSTYNVTKDTFLTGAEYYDPQKDQAPPTLGDLPENANYNPHDPDSTLLVPDVAYAGYFAVLDLPQIEGDFYVRMEGEGVNTSGKQDITYHFLNPVSGTDCNDRGLGTNYADYIDAKNGSDRISGLAGDDVIVGGAGYNQIDGGEGDDEIHVEQGRDTIVVCRNSGNDTIFGFDQGDTVYITSSARTKLKVSDVQYEKDLDYVPVGTDGDYELKAIYGNAVKIELGCGNNSLTLIGLQSQDLCIGSNTIRVHA